MAATLREIAQDAGVSIQTVSRILRGEHHRHHQDTCQRVLDVAQKLNYRPNLLGRALQSGRTHSVGVIRLGMGDRNQHNIYGMICEARLRDYQLLLSLEEAWHNDHDAMFLKTVDDLLGRQVDGLIIHRGVPLEPPTRKYLASLKVPVLYMSWAPPQPCHHVELDNQDGVRQIILHFRELGHRRMALFPSPGAMDFPGHGIHPVQRTCRELGMEVVVVTPDPSFPKIMAEEYWTHDSVTKYLARTQDDPARRATAMLFPGFNGVHGGMLALHKAGLRVPGDVSVANMEEAPLNDLSKPGITSLHRDWEGYGRLVFKTMYELIQKPPEKPVKICMPSKLIVRDSTGPAAAR